MPYSREILINNIFTYFKKKGIRPNDFCVSVGYSPQTLSNFFNGKTQLPRIDLIYAFIKYDPDLNIRWLIANEGEMFSKVIRIKEKLPEDDPRQMIKSLREMVDHLLKENKRLKGE